MGRLAIVFAVIALISATLRIVTPQRIVAAAARAANAPERFQRAVWRGLRARYEATPALAPSGELMDFPRASQYNPEWLMSAISGAANPLWMAEWLTADRPETRHESARPRLWPSRLIHLSASRIRRPGLGRRSMVQCRRKRAAHPGRRQEDGIFPIHADARALPFAPGFFDAILSFDSFIYYGTDDLYLNYLGRFLKPGGVLAIAGAGLTREFEDRCPEHLANWWTPDMWCLHSAAWWRRHWQRTGIVNVEFAETMPEGWRVWLDWHRIIAPDNKPEIEALEADAGRFLGYVRVAARRTDLSLTEPLVTIPAHYTAKPLLTQPTTGTQISTTP
jgi:hypothetical protein